MNLHDHAVLHAAEWQREFCSKISCRGAFVAPALGVLCLIDLMGGCVTVYRLWVFMLPIPLSCWEACVIRDAHSVSESCSLHSLPQVPKSHSHVMDGHGTANFGSMQCFKDVRRHVPVVAALDCSAQLLTRSLLEIPKSMYEYLRKSTLTCRTATASAIIKQVRTHECCKNRRQSGRDER